MEQTKKQAVLVALLAAKKAGVEILEIYKKDFEVEFKEDESPLTAADLAAHKIISATLNNHSLGLIGGERFPILSEEGKNIPYETRKEWDCYWLIDPIDGTKEFVKRNGEFTVNIAFMKGKPIAGVVYVPVKGAYYFAAEGLGSYYLEQENFIAELEGALEENPDEATINSLFDAFIAASVKLPMTEGLNKPLYVVGSRSHASPKLDDFNKELSKKYGEVEVISAGSSLKFCLVAEGKADVYPRFGLTSEWDTGAGQIVVEEADCVVLNMETGKPMDYNKENLLNPFFIIKKNALDI